MGIPCIRYGDLYTYHNTFIEHTRSCVSAERAPAYTPIRFGDVLFAASGETIDEIGQSAVNLMSTEARCGGDVILLRLDTDVDAEFIGYAADSPFAAFQKARMGRGITVMHIYGDQLKCLALPIPTLSEQRTIAAFLDRETAEIDALVAKKERLIKLLQEKRTALITHAVTKGLDPNVPMKDSGVEWLHKIPLSWRMKRLKHLVREPLAYGANEPARLIDPEQPRYVRITDIADDGTLKHDTLRSIPEELAADYLLSDGDILLARSGATVGKAFRYSSTWGKAAHAGYLIRVRVDDRVVRSDFVLYFTQSHMYREWLLANQIQSTIQNVSADRYASLTIPTSECSEQRTITSFLDRETVKIDALLSKVHEAIDRLKELRTSLISAAVTGKIDVRETAA